MNINELTLQIQNDELQDKLIELYGSEAYMIQKSRFLSLISKFKNAFSQQDIRIVSSPGRTELGGNHTDHNYGRVLAASIQLDSIAVAAINSSPVVQVHSEGFAEVFSVDLESLEDIHENEDSTTSLLRGILSVFRSRGYKIGGFNAYISSDVLIGSGLSSSASIEILLGKILSVLFNSNSIDAVELAKIGQEAENIFLEKPCGLMDQIACAYGGIVSIDFEDPSSPVIDSVDYSFEENGFKLLVVDTGGDHADLTEDYAAIPLEMKNVAQFFGKSVCRFIKKEDLIKKIPEISRTLGDRAVLRALHFLEEDRRVGNMAASLKQNRLSTYLKNVRNSGDSSYKLLQNVFTSRYVSDQKISLAIALTETYPDFDGAVRVHGGGFAGTVQVYISNDKSDEYTEYMEHFFGPQSVTILKIRKSGALLII